MQRKGTGIRAQQLPGLHARSMSSACFAWVMFWDCSVPRPLHTASSVCHQCVLQVLGADLRGLRLLKS